MTALPKAYGNKVRGPYSEEHRKGHKNCHQGHHKGKAAQGRLVDCPAYKDPIHHIVKGAYYHPGNCGEGKAEKQAAHRFCSKAFRCRRELSTQRVLVWVGIRRAGQKKNSYRNSKQNILFINQAGKRVKRYATPSVVCLNYTMK
jgi:hypothetical protein